MRSAAWAVECTQRLKQWGLAFQIYATANDLHYPHIDGLDRGSSAADNCGWVDVLPPLMDHKPWREYERNDYPNEKTIYQCPDARIHSEEDYGYRPLRDGYFSYAMNSCLELDDNCWPPHDNTGWPMPSFLKTVKIEAPARCILLFEQLMRPSLGYDGETRYRNAGKYCGSYPKAFSARHTRGSALGGFVLYCDYHVAHVSSVWKPEWPDDLEVPFRNDPDWFPYPDSP
jgi:hypothetical protein